MIGRPSPLAAVVVATALVGCAGDAPWHRTAASVPDRHIALFAVPAEPLQPRIDRSKDRGTYTVQRLTFESVLRAPGLPPVETYFYLPKEGRRFPLVLILPITRGDFFSTEFAVYFAERGFACVRFRSQGDVGRLYGDPASLPMFRDLLRARVIDTRRVLDWALRRSEIDDDRVALVGFSHGAIVGSLVAAVDHRIKAAALVLAGGDLAGIIRDSGEQSLARIREGLMADHDLTAAEFYDAASAALEDVDPLTYAPLVSPRAILMINARFDRVIRRPYAEALWRGLGRPELVWIPAGHYTAGLFTSYARHKILDHLTRVLRVGT
ncbi:MAG: alpha/beta hydrolase family protein [Nitrospirota bacterium]